MAGQGPTVVLTFAGDSGPLDRTAKKVTATMGGLGKSLGGLASAGGAVQGIGGLAGALTQLAPAALLLPGALLGAQAAMATFKIATAGMSDAISAGLSGDMEAFAEATKNMAPAARETAQAFADFKPQVDALKQSVQGTFFEGLADQVRTLGKNYLPIMQTGLTGIAAELGNMATKSIQAANTPFFQNDVKTILANTTTSLFNMNGALRNVLTGFVGLGAVGSSYLPALGSAIDSVTERFTEWVDRGIETGSIKAMVDGAIQGFRDLGAIVGNVGSILSSVFTGLGGDATSFLGPLRDATTQLAAFMASASAQEALGALGEAMRAAGTLLREVFIAALQTLAPIVTALAPIIAGVATTLAEWAPVLGPAAIGVLALAGAIKGIVAGVALYNSIMTTVRALTVAWAGVQWVLNAALSANPIGLVVIAIAALVAGLIWAYNESETFRNIVNGAWEAVKTGIGSAVDWIKGAIAWFGELPGLVGGWFGGMKDSAISKALELVTWVSGLPGRFMSVLGNIGSLLLDSGRALIDGFRRGLSAAWDGLVSWFRGQLAWFRGLWPFSPAKWGPFSGSGYVDRSGEALVTDFASSLRAGVPDVGRAGTELMGAASGSLSGAALGGGRPAAPAGAGAREVRFSGNVDSAFATAFMKLVRTGQIQIG